MKLYLDIVFIVNFGINFIFLYLILTLFNEKVSFIRLFISSLCAGFILVAMIFDIIVYNLFKIFGGMFLTLIGVGTHRFILKSSSFYLLHFALTGIVESFNIRYFYLLLALAIVCTLIAFENFRRKSIFSNQLKYNISVTLNNKLLNLDGYLDTGNIICHNNIPIIFINDRYFIEGLKASQRVFVETINGYSIVHCYTPSKFIININNKLIKKEVYIAFSKLDTSIDCLLNYYLIF